MFHVLDDLSTERTREILEEQARMPGSKIGDFYASFMEREHGRSRGHPAAVAAPPDDQNASSSPRWPG
jgi:hypothetical protein